MSITIKKFLGRGSSVLNANTTLVITATTETTAGNLFVGTAWVSHSTTLESVSDSKGNMYNVRTPFITGTERLYFFDSNTTSALAASDTITLTFSSTAGRKLATVTEFTGVANPSFSAQGTGISGSSSTPTIAVSSPSQANSVIVTALYYQGSSTWITAEDPEYTWMDDVVVQTSYALHYATREMTDTSAHNYVATLNVSRAYQLNYAIYNGYDEPIAPLSGGKALLLGVG